MRRWRDLRCWAIVSRNTDLARSMRRCLVAGSMRSALVPTSVTTLRGACSSSSLTQKRTHCISLSSVHSLNSPAFSCSPLMGGEHERSKTIRYRVRCSVRYMVLPTRQYTPWPPQSHTETLTGEFSLGLNCSMSVPTVRASRAVSCVVPLRRVWKREDLPASPRPRSIHFMRRSWLEPDSIASLMMSTTLVPPDSTTSRGITYWSSFPLMSRLSRLLFSRSASISDRTALSSSLLFVKSRRLRRAADPRKCATMWAPAGPQRMYMLTRLSWRRSARSRDEKVLRVAYCTTLCARCTAAVSLIALSKRSSHTSLRLIFMMPATL
mmetsp:Transcript_36307/g.114592  ORF Transcript_36307/g.114592 Transcript_36307/m.114592 type:complete len:323 (-) Transcript_36307:1723-2691(-)